MRDDIGVVVIGRNEGERLIRCLKSIAAMGQAMGGVVYVDSGSSDGSVAAARGLGVVTIGLDTSVPFTAGRARNAGMTSLLELSPRIRFVQFVDGDCELAGTWFAFASAVFERQARTAVVSGRLRERFRQATVYNKLCDMEWDAPPGEAEACGGIAMVRVDAFGQAGGFDAGLIAGEEPELCLRLRRAGWKVWRLAEPMATHDAAMERFGQWWKRTLRGGHAFAEGAWMHGSVRGGHFVRNVYRALLWGIGVPGMLIFSFIVAMIWPPAFAAVAVLALAIFASGYRAMRWRRSHSDSFSDSVLYAVFCVIGKLPEALGVLRFHTLRLRNRRGELVEYK